MQFANADIEGFYSAERLYFRLPKNTAVRLYLSPAQVALCLEALRLVETRDDGARWRPARDWRLERFRAACTDLENRLITDRKGVLRSLKRGS